MILPHTPANLLANGTTMKYVIWTLVVLLIILHQDNWNWTKPDLVFGFIPIGLAWHAGISISASIVWYLATVFIWPNELEYTEDESSQEVSS